MEKVLAQLPTAGGALQDSESERRMVGHEELVKPIQQVNDVLRLEEVKGRLFSLEV
ncbi:MAG TPA: hypothetical protein VFX91_12450 [Alcanivorax sp.]|nr:hypothetical protein [Alcanivorax sp.]